MCLDDNGPYYLKNISVPEYIIYPKLSSDPGEWSKEIKEILPTVFWYLYRWISSEARGSPSPC